MPPHLTRIFPHRKDGPYDSRHISVAELDEKTDRLMHVISMVVEFGKLALGLAVVKTTPDGGGKVCTGEFRVQDVFEVPGSTKRRDGTTPPKERASPPKRANVTHTGPRSGELSMMRYVV